MKNQLKTIREFFDSISVPYEALSAFEQIEAMAGEQEPVACVGSYWNDGKGFDLCDFSGNRPAPGAKLYAAPVAQQPQAKPHKPLFADLIAQHPGLREELLEMDKQPQAEAVPPDVVRDAERYRKLRTFHWSESSMCVVLDPKKSVLLGAVCPSDTNLDDYIDAAIAQQKGPK